MKKVLLTALLSTLLLSSAWAEDAPHADKKMKPSTAMTDKNQKMNMDKMQENMLRMHEQMHKIMQSSDVKERVALMEAHSKMMQESMRMMHGMKGDEMMGHDKMNGGMKGQ